MTEYTIEYKPITIKEDVDWLKIINNMATLQARIETRSILIMKSLGLSKNMGDYTESSLTYAGSIPCIQIILKDQDKKEITKVCIYIDNFASDKQMNEYISRNKIREEEEIDGSCIG